jgi:2-dehydro-3-deoxyglucarate aldolase/4-hydroxy-2-oxoheptanedioate aldolase
MARDTKKTQPLFLLWLLTPSTAAVELSALLRFQGICMDLEHGAFNRESVDRLVLLAHALRLTAYARVMAPTRIALQHVLDSGADGVVIPHIDGLEHAREVTGYCKYPSLGTRSVGGGRTWDWGNPPEDWIRRENRRVQCYPMIETAEALEEVGAIAALPTVDGLFLGPFDLNMARGRGGRMGTPEDAADLQRVARAARKAGKHWGMNIYSAQDRRVARRLGLRLAALSDDVTALSAGLSQVIEDARREMGG